MCGHYVFLYGVNFSVMVLGKNRQSFPGDFFRMCFPRKLKPAIVVYRHQIPSAVYFQMVLHHWPFETLCGNLQALFRNLWKSGAPGLSPFQPLDIIGIRKEEMFPANWKLDIHKLGLLPCYPATGVNAVGLRVLWAHKLRFGRFQFGFGRYVKENEVKNCSDASSYIMKGMILSHCILRLGLGALQETWGRRSAGGVVLRWEVFRKTWMYQIFFPSKSLFQGNIDLW